MTPRRYRLTTPISLPGFGEKTARQKFRPAAEQQLEGAPWTMPPDRSVRVEISDSPYIVDVDFVRDATGAYVASGVSVHRAYPFLPVERAVPEPELRWPEDLEPEPVSPRDVRRLPLASYIQAATAAANKPLDERGEAIHKALSMPRGRPEPGKSTQFYADILETFEALKAQGEPAPAKALATRKRVPVNTVHQWLYRARQLRQKGK